MGTARALVAAALVGLVLTTVGCAWPGPGAMSSPPAARPTPSAEPAPHDPVTPTRTAPVPTDAPPSTPAPSGSAPASSPPPEPRPPSDPPATQPPARPTTAPARPTASDPAAPTGVPAAWRGIDLERIATDRRVVALTFDGGSSDAGLAPILAVLARERVPATFFVTGRFARTYPAGVASIAAAGHPVGNHSDTHPSLPDLRDAAIAVELARAEASISAATGRPAKPLFRFPFGARTPYDIGVVNDLGYVSIRWSVDSLGWLGTSRGGSAAAVAERVVGAAEPGMIALMHVGANPDDGTTFDADALPSIIQRLRAAGYGFVDLGDLVR